MEKLVRASGQRNKCTEVATGAGGRKTTLSRGLQSASGRPRVDSQGWKFDTNRENRPTARTLEIRRRDRRNVLT